MSRITRPTFLVGILAIAAASVLIAKFPGREPGLVVHEWGTFTSVAGEDGSAIDWNVLGSRDDLPNFVVHRGFFKLGLSGTVRMETPVLYFYSPEELSVHVKVSFPKGLITEWYPKADTQIEQKTGAEGPTYRVQDLNGIDRTMSRVTGGIEWKNVNIEPGTMPSFRREDRPSRYYAARDTDAAPVSVGEQHEKFLFYRGVGRFAVPLSARLSDDQKVVLNNCYPDEIPLAIRFENRGGRMGYSIGHSLSGSVTLDPPVLGVEFAPLGEELKSTLVTQGLFAKEAQAMVDTWRDSWFEEGSRVIYIVPSRSVNEVLPLQIDPLPFQTVRVFVGRIELITRETKRAVDAAISANDRCVVDRYGRFLEPILARIVMDDPSAKARIDQYWANEMNLKPSAACL